MSKRTHFVGLFVLVCCGGTTPSDSDADTSTGESGTTASSVGTTSSDGNPTADSTGGQDSGGATTSTSTSATGDAESSSSGEPIEEPDLPGFIEGVEPESHSHHPPMIDTNGNLYRLTESPANDGNNPKMMLSTNGGETWEEADAGNRPEADDLEGCWQLQVGTSIYISVAASDEVWFSVFNTSDAADSPDQWVVDDEVVADLGNSGGVVQFSSMATTSDGQTWLFHSGTVTDDRQQIEYRRRSAAGDWGPGQDFEDSAGSWTGPRLLPGASDVTHVFYKDHLADELFWRTLGPDGTLSGATRIDEDGTSDVRIPQTMGVVYDAGGQETVTIGYADADGLLRAVTIVDGAVDGVELVAPDPVLEDPSVAANDGTVAHFAVDETTVHVLWTDLDSGDVLHAERPDGGGWSDAEVAWSSGDNIAWWVYGNVYDRNGKRRLGFTYDIGEHRDDTGNIEYDEIILSR